MNGIRTLKLSWIFHRKFKNGVFEKNKGRLVARSNHQRPGIDYGESFLPIMRLESLRTILALAAIRDLNIIQFDITSTYLHSTLKEEVYMEQPEGYIAPGKEDWVWGLKRGLYGLVQTGRTWNEKLDVHMESEGFMAAAKDPAIYVRNSWASDDFAAVGLWVDDCVVIGSGQEFDNFLKSVDAKYGMERPGRGQMACCWSGTRSGRTIAISQEAFTDSTLVRFNLLTKSLLRAPHLSCRIPLHRSGGRL